MTKINYKPRRFYVYGLFDPAEDFPFYIGKGTGNRLNKHFADCYKGFNPHKDRKIEKIRKKGRKPYSKKLHKNLTEKQAFLKEWVLINKHFNKLTNIKRKYGTGAQSGKRNHFYGCTHSEESKKKMSKSHPDRNGKNNPMYGTSRSHSQESIKKMRQSSSGEQNGNAKIKKQEAAEIKWLVQESSFRNRKIAEKYDVSMSIVEHISSGHNWTSVEPIKPKSKPERRQCVKKVKEIKAAALLSKERKNMNYKDVGAIYDRSVNGICHIVNGRTYDYIEVDKKDFRKAKNRINEAEREQKMKNQFFNLNEK